jgi:FtsP/CotA-like multicopper oxidase with cupredoxin domain
LLGTEVVTDRVGLMKKLAESRRKFLKAASLTTGAVFLSSAKVVAESGISPQSSGNPAASESGSADYTLHIKSSAIEIAPNRIISATTYNGQFPGPLLRFKEGQLVTVEVYNHTDIAEQLHWHGQMVPVDVDGAAEEGTPFIPAHGKRRIVLTPRPAGFRFYHTHNRAGADLYAGQYGGEVGPVYIEPKHEQGDYDREVFLVLKEFEPTFSRGGDMAQDFLPPTKVKQLEEQGELASAVKAEC